LNASRKPAQPVQPVALRRIILEQSKRANVGHIGSALSVADILAALYSGILRIERPDDPERDRFILSKGHAALALYAALHLRGLLDAETLDTYCGDGSLLGVHPRARSDMGFRSGRERRSARDSKARLVGRSCS